MTTEGREGAFNSTSDGGNGAGRSWTAAPFVPRLPLFL